METNFIKRDTWVNKKDDINAETLLNDCICNRPHCNVICKGCGYWTKGRVRYNCPQHPQIIFLHDIAQCPHCRSYNFMLTEF